MSKNVFFWLVKQYLLILSWLATYFLLAFAPATHCQLKALLAQSRVDGADGTDEADVAAGAGGSDGADGADSADEAA